jgi:hypothetical protein
MRYFFVLAATLFLLSAGSAFALGDRGPIDLPGDRGKVAEKETVSLSNPLAAKDITQLFSDIIDIILIFAVPIIVFFIIYAGFLYVTARGNENTIQKAHKALLFALVGGLLILGAKVLIEVISGTVDIFRE